MKNKWLVWLALIALVAGMLSLFFDSPEIGQHTEYECDVKNFRLSTEIVIRTAGERIAKVSGNIFRIVEDPLTMRDNNGNRIAYAGDDYHFISQDSHVIIVDGVVTAEMVGRWDLFGETYDIYKEGKKIAKATFNWPNTYGKIEDLDGNLIADYESFIWFNDFDVRISEDCPIDNMTALMIFCSYYSDQNYDNS